MSEIRFFSGDRPSTETFPSVGKSMPQSNFIVVLLPPVRPGIGDELAAPDLEGHIIKRIHALFSQALRAFFSTPFPAFSRWDWVNTFTTDRTSTAMSDGEVAVDPFFNIVMQSFPEKVSRACGERHRNDCGVIARQVERRFSKQCKRWKPAQQPRGKHPSAEALQRKRHAGEWELRQAALRIDYIS